MLQWDIPQNWGLVRLGDVAPEVSSQISPKNEPDRTFNYWSLDAISQGQIDEPGPNYVLGSAISSTCVSFTPNHVLYAKLRPYLNKVIVPSVDGVGSTEWVVLAPNQSVLDRKYLGYLLRTNNFVQHMTESSAGARMPRARKDVLFDSQIPVPFPNDPARSLETQRRIVLRLEALLAEVKSARELQEKIISDNDSLLEAYMRDIFSPAEQEIPDGWMKNPINIFAKTTSGGTPSRKKSEYFTGNIPWVKSGELNDGYIEDTGEKITDDAIRKSSAKLFPQGTLLIALYGATTGKLGILGIQAATNQAVCAILLDEEMVTRDYLFWYLRWHRKTLLAGAKGGAQPNISQDVVKNIIVPYPIGLNAQKKIAVQLEDINAEIKEMQKGYSEISELINSLEQSFIAQAFRGEL